MPADDLYEAIVSALPLALTVAHFPSEDPRQSVLLAANTAAGEALGMDLTPYIGVPTDPRDVTDDFNDTETDEVLGLSHEVATTGRVRQVADLAIRHGPARGRYRVTIFPLGGRRAASVFQRIDAELEATEALEWALRSLQSTNADLNQFASTVAHDLRNPLTGIKGNAQLLGMVAGELPDPARTAVERIVELSSLSASMIDDLLHFARRPAGNSAGAVPLDEVVAWVESLLVEQLATGDATLAHDALPTVSGHATPIRQVFLNVIANSLRYRHPDRPLEISIAATDGVPVDGQVRVDVTDNGQGIIETEVERVFEWGYRSDRSAAIAPGTGIGLAASRAVMSSLGGHIWVDEPPPDGGTTMSLSFPVAPVRG